MATKTEEGVMLNRVLFHTRYQEEDESILDFATDVKKLLRVCCYAADCLLLDGLARDKFIAGVTDKELQAFLSTQQANISFDNVIDLCLNFQNSDIKTEAPETEKIYGKEGTVELALAFPYPVDAANAFDIKFEDSENREEEETYHDSDSLTLVEDREQSVENENGRRCLYCDYHADERSILDKHILAVHGTEKLFKCDQCGFSTGWKCSLRKHILKVHNNPSDFPYTCNDCGFSTKFSRVYKNHLMSLKIIGKCEVSKEKHDASKTKYKPNEPMKCPHCNYTRTQRSKILNHIKSVHEDSKPFKCTQCKSSFKLKFRLTAHMKLSHGDGKVKIFQILYCLSKLNKRHSLCYLLHLRGRLKHSINSYSIFFSFSGFYHFSRFCNSFIKIELRQLKTGKIFISHL